jgi:hypothetical protein
MGFGNRGVILATLLQSDPRPLTAQASDQNPNIWEQTLAPQPFMPLTWGKSHFNFWVSGPCNLENKCSQKQVQEWIDYKSFYKSWLWVCLGLDHIFIQLVLPRLLHCPNFMLALVWELGNSSSLGTNMIKHVHLSYIYLSNSWACMRISPANFHHIS